MSFYWKTDLILEFRMFLKHNMCQNFFEVHMIWKTDKILLSMMAIMNNKIRKPWTYLPIDLFWHRQIWPETISLHHPRQLIHRLTRWVFVTWTQKAKGRGKGGGSVQWRKIHNCLNNNPKKGGYWGWYKINTFCEIYLVPKNYSFSTHTHTQNVEIFSSRVGVPE